jgi:AcrR family transcriptional regulator
LPRSLARDHEEKKARMARRAARVFARTGFDKAAMDEVAASCGVAKGALYHYFGGKEELLHFILARHLGAIRDRLAAIDPVGDPPARIARLILEILLAYRGGDDEHRLQMNALGRLPAGRRESLKVIQREIVRLMERAVVAAGPPTLGRDKRQLRAATMSLFGMLNWFYLWNRESGIKAREDYARLVARLFLDGVKAI